MPWVAVARYPGPDGLLRAAPHVFLSRTEAEHWLSVVESDLCVARGSIRRPGGCRSVSTPERCINERLALAPKTRVL